VREFGDPLYHFTQAINGESVALHVYLLSCTIDKVYLLAITHPFTQAVPYIELMTQYVKSNLELSEIFCLWSHCNRVPKLCMRVWCNTSEGLWQWSVYYTHVYQYIWNHREKCFKSCKLVDFFYLPQAQHNNSQILHCTCTNPILQITNEKNS